MTTATLKLRAKDTPADEIGMVNADGYLVSNAFLAKLGDGDVKQGRRTLRMMLADERDPVIHNGPTARPPAVRVAIARDEARVLELVLMELEEVAKHVALIDPDEVRANVRAALGMIDGIAGIVGVIDHQGVPVATVGMVALKWWFSKAYHVMELWNYVHPDHRRSTHAADLIQFVKWASDEWSRQFGHRVYGVGNVLSTIRTKAKVRLYRRHMNQAGGIFLYPWPQEG